MRPFMAIGTTLLGLAAAASIACGDDDPAGETPVATVTISATAAQSPTTAPTMTPTAAPTAIPTATPRPATPTATPTVAGQAALPGHPADKRAGVAAVDSFINLLYARDAKALAALSNYREMKCVAKVEGSGAPPECPAGVAEGTLVKVLSGGQCEGFWIFPDKAVDSFARWVERFGLWAVWVQETDGGPNSRPVGTYGIYATGQAGPGAPVVERTMFIKDGKIEALFFGCSRGPSSAAPAGARFILPPPQ